MSRREGNHARHRGARSSRPGVRTLAALLEGSLQEIARLIAIVVSREQANRKVGDAHHTRPDQPGGTLAVDQVRRPERDTD